MKKDNLFDLFQSESIEAESVLNTVGGQGENTIHWETDFGESTYDSDCHCMISDCRDDSGVKRKN